MSDIKPIETVYNGRRFRSRLEARWAVFFDALGIAWEYEREGYDIDGTWYLPDFWISAIQSHVEIKPLEQWFYNELCFRLAAKSKQKVLYIAGSPYPGNYRIALYEPSNDEAICSGSDPFEWALGRDEGEIWLYSDYYYLCLNPIGDSDKFATARYSRRLMEAFTQATSARFEHGEKG